MLLVYTQNLTPRIAYIFSTLLPATGIASFDITGDIEAYKSFDGPRINYSHTKICDEEFSIAPHLLLFENDVKAQQIECFEWLGLKAFFKTPGSDIPFDVFAASFYLLSRYEEYLPHDKDEYGRYAHTNSIAFKQEFLQLPLVNLWLKQLANLLQQKFPKLQFSPATFSYLPTYDIDIAWSYFSKGITRNVGGLIKSLIKLDRKGLAERLRVLLAYQDDPFDIYAWLDDLHKKYQLNPIYFFLVAAKTGRYDKNTSPNNRLFQMLISKLSVMHKSGLHPSWQSGDNEELFKQEQETLQKITRRPVTVSRQHYIRMQLPGTYQLLLQQGMVNDHSMGYGSINGFRASYCLPFKWFDLSNNEETGLTIFPFCYMEANSMFEQKLSAEQALNEIQHYYDVVQQVNGMFITIFHNHLITTQPLLLPWRQMYEKFLEKNFGQA